MALVGNLRDLKLPNLIQLNCMERNTAKLTVEHAGKYGFVYFQGGQIAHAEYEPDIGEKALFRLLALTDGKFKVEGGIRPPTVTIQNHWNNLLLEGLHQLDNLQSSDEGMVQHFLNMLMNVRGVVQAAVISQTGEVIATTFELGKDSILHALTFYEATAMKGMIKTGNPDFINLVERNKRTLITAYGEHIAYIELEAKSQLETVLPFIKQVMGQYAVP